MNKERLKRIWLAEEKQAHIHGWDFSHIDGRFEEENDLPWDYRRIVEKYLNPESRLLDMDTGGGEFLLSLQHSNHLISATEAYLPNVLLCSQKLIPLGINFKQADGNGILPFANDTFDLVINRHGAFHENEIFRVLRQGGIFVTQQVGSENDRALIDLLVPNVQRKFKSNNLENVTARFMKAGFTVLESNEFFGNIQFYDVAALVWFAKIIEWEFGGFSVNSCLDNLYQAQKILNQNGCIRGKTHRFILVAKK